MDNIISAILLVVFGAIVIALLAAWPVMVLWGAVADDFGIQTLGLGTAWQLSALTALLFKSSTASAS